MKPRSYFTKGGIRVTREIRNRDYQPRRLSAVFYAEWVLGTVRDQAASQVVCSLDDSSEALLARNWWNVDFANQVAFAATTRRPHSVTSGSQSRSSEKRVRTPRPTGGCHQCCTSPSLNWCAAARRSCARVSCGAP